MAIDYGTRRQVGRNRPKRRPVKLFLLLILGGASVVYGLGIATGWVMFRTDGKEAAQTASPPPPVRAAGRGTTQAPTTAAAPPHGATVPGGETPLTFFKTLPNGEKEIMGTGINLPHPEKVSPGTGATTPAPPAEMKQQPRKPDKPAAEQVVSDNPKPKPETATQIAETRNGQQPQGTEKGSFTVQVASCKERKEAEELKASLEKKGFSVRVTEFNVNGKGTWYRVRIGRALGRDEASQLAARLGKNAMVLPE